jgi:1,4-dihydroxy-2-naphthoyl-CoA hydrolase
LLFTREVIDTPPLSGNPAVMTGPTSLDTDGLHALVPLSATLGIRLAAATADRVRLQIDWREDLCTAGGVLHGGAIMSVADTAGAVCAYLNLSAEGEGTATIDSKTNLFGAVRAGTLTATATPLHVGRSFIVVETALRDDDDHLVAKTTQTQAVLRG